MPGQYLLSISAAAVSGRMPEIFAFNPAALPRRPALVWASVLFGLVPIGTPPTRSRRA